MSGLSIVMTTICKLKKNQLYRIMSSIKLKLFVWGVILVRICFRSLWVLLGSLSFIVSHQGSRISSHWRSEESIIWQEVLNIQLTWWAETLRIALFNLLWSNKMNFNFLQSNLVTYKFLINGLRCSVNSWLSHSFMWHLLTNIQSTHKILRLQYPKKCRYVSNPRTGMSWLR